MRLDICEATVLALAFNFLPTHHIYTALHGTFNFLCWDATISKVICLNFLINYLSPQVTFTTLAYYSTVTPSGTIKSSL